MVSNVVLIWLCWCRIEEDEDGAMWVFFVLLLIEQMVHRLLGLSIIEPFGSTLSSQGCTIFFNPFGSTLSYQRE